MGDYDGVVYEVEILLSTTDFDNYAYNQGSITQFDVDIRNFAYA